MEMQAPQEEGSDVAEGAPEATPLRPGRPQGGKPVPPGRGADSADLEQAIAVLRARVEEEFRISERLDTKGRQTFALAAAFFAVVQTLAFGSGVDGAERGLLGILALFAGLAVYVTAHRLTNGEDLLDEDDVKPDAIVDWCNEATEKDYVAVRIVSRLRTVANNRTENNRRRARSYDRVQQAARIALIVSGVELIFAILVRI